MASSVGVLTKAAFKKAATWGTAVACGAGDGVLIRPSGFKKSRENVIDNSLGLYWPKTSDVGEIKADGDIAGYLRYDTPALEMLLAMAMGTCTTTLASPTATGTADASGSTTTLKDTGGFASGVAVGQYIQITQGSTVYTRKITVRTDDQVTWVGAVGSTTNAPDTWKVASATSVVNTKQYDLASSIDGQFVTGALYNGAYIDELTSAKVTGFTIKGQVGQPIEVSFNMIASDRTAGSSTNTTVTFANVTFAETDQRVLMRHLAMRMNAQSGGALSSPGDVISPSSFELTFSRKMAGVYGLGGNFDTIDEPTIDGVPEVSLKLEFPRVTAATYFTAWEAQTAQKLDMTFTFGSYSVLIQFPNLKFASVDTPSAEGIIKMPVEFNALGCATSPTGFTTLTTPFRITFVNTTGFNPLEFGN